MTSSGLRARRGEKEWLVDGSDRREGPPCNAPNHHFPPRTSKKRVLLLPWSWVCPVEPERRFASQLRFFFSNLLRLEKKGDRAVPRCALASQTRSTFISPQGASP